MSETIGAYTYGNPEIKKWGGTNANLTIGNYCSIGSNVKIYLGGNHRIDTVTTFPFQERLQIPSSKSNRCNAGDIVIGSDIWIGDDVTILSGSKIGHGAVIGNGSVVRGRIKPYSVSSGNPCNLLYYRFSRDVINSLLKIAWWNWPHEKIIDNLDFIQGDPDRFIGFVLNCE